MTNNKRNLDPKRQAVLERRRQTRKIRYSSYRKTEKDEEKATSFFVTAKRLLGYLKAHKLSFVLVIITCIVSTVCKVVGPTDIGTAGRDKNQRRSNFTRKSCSYSVNSSCHLRRYGGFLLHSAVHNGGYNSKNRKKAS